MAWEELMSKLTPREQQICEALRKEPSLTARGVGRHVDGISHRTVEWHLRHLYAKIGVNNRLDLVVKLREENPPNTLVT